MLIAFAELMRAVLGGAIGLGIFAGVAKLLKIEE